MNNKCLINLSYTKGPDGLLYPDIDLGVQKPIGRYGRMWKDMMLQKHPQQVSKLLLYGELHKTMQKVDQEAEQYREDMLQALLIKNPMPQTDDILGRAAHMDMLYRMADEITVREFLADIV